MTGEAMLLRSLGLAFLSSFALGCASASLSSATVSPVVSEVTEAYSNENVIFRVRVKTENNSSTTYCFPRVSEEREVYGFRVYMDGVRQKPQSMWQQISDPSLPEFNWNTVHIVPPGGGMIEYLDVGAAYGDIGRSGLTIERTVAAIPCNSLQNGYVQIPGSVSFIAEPSIYEEGSDLEEAEKHLREGIIRDLYPEWAETGIIVNMKSYHFPRDGRENTQ